VGIPTAAVGVVADAEPDVQAVGTVAALEEQVPHGERVLAAADGHEDPVVGPEHVEVLDRLVDLAATELLQVLGTEVGVVAREVDHRRALARPALAACRCHRTPQCAAVTLRCHRR
jgi:hypothetical protein